DYAFTIKEIEPIPYPPYRVVTTSPVLFMVLVPAGEAIKISRFLHQQYVDHFGKVTGRLPFSVGNIFFFKKTPMFVVLDAAKRMVESFEELHKEEKTFILKGIPPAWQCALAPRLDLKVAHKEQSDITWQVPLKLGDCSVDHFHPYMMVRENICGHEPRNRPSYLPLLDGAALHVCELEQGDVIRAYPNYYDFEFLDTTTRRYDLQMVSNGKRSHPFFGEGGTRPYFLEQLDKIQNLWQRLKSVPELTDTKLKNMETLLQSRISEWRVSLQETSPAYEALVESVLAKEFSMDSDSEEFKGLKQAMLSGLFFDCLELYLKILKQRVKEE
ncbi:MAG: hypothetical protein DRP09_17005, partial [Candidatus Thorarchaeota archaeon]